MGGGVVAGIEGALDEYPGEEGLLKLHVDHYGLNYGVLFYFLSESL